MALHYKIPYPRLTNVIPGSTGEKPETVMPPYMHSYDDVGRAKAGISQRRPEYEE